MSSSAAFADIVLPAAWYYEKDDTTITFGLNRYMALIQQAVAPRGEAKPEWEIFAALARKVRERAKERGLSSFRDASGKERRYQDLGDRFTMSGHLESHEDVVREYMTMLARPACSRRGRLRRAEAKGQLRSPASARAHPATRCDRHRPWKPIPAALERRDRLPYATARARAVLHRPRVVSRGRRSAAHLQETPPIGGMHRSGW
jgi:anaerobic selenocysteine-containing dehydrogenase